MKKYTPTIFGKKSVAHSFWDKSEVTVLSLSQNAGYHNFTDN